MTSTTFTLLLTFSLAANKSAAASHPLDRQRWHRFVTAAHKENADLDSLILQNWLIKDENWPEGLALKLSNEYELSRDLLAFYDQQQ
ncbi:MULTISPECIES: hypothetical protein [Trichocoleus]|uniref:Uncharacterized protein n=1 Tax=Trichocoleus desertorum GB2-A4 TaxID=2933944 RepID=A0ABV0JE70_9CYAN|nr:hypothetical protein [Trichocoleus sp. FACHB-46]MBD1864238.1 hypothetical protein [Trichocoleus sp. FACHB-46]